jgi:hypothetical protein
MYVLLAAAVSTARVIILVVCVGIAFALGRIVNYRRLKEHERSEKEKGHGGQGLG